MAVGPGRNRVASIEDSLRGGSFSFQNGPIRDLAVPLDQRRNCAAASDDGLEQLPHGIGNGTVVAVDEEQVAFVISLLGMAREVNLANAREGKFRQILQSGEAMIGGGHEDVV